MKIFFVSFFCVFLPPLFNLFCRVHNVYVLYCAIFAWNGPLVSLIFLKRSIVFPTPLFSSISLHWSLRKAFLTLLAILWNSEFRWIYLSFFPLSYASLLSQLLLSPPQTAILPFCISFWGDGLDHYLMYNVTTICPLFFRHSIRSNPLNLFVTSIT